MIYVAISADAYSLPSLPDAVNSLTEQCDNVFVFIDRPFPYNLINEAMRQITNHDKVKVTITDHKGDMNIFAIASQITKEDTVVICSSEHIYPNNYVDTIIACYDENQAKCVSYCKGLGFSDQSKETTDIPTNDIAISGSLIKDLAPSADFIGNRYLFIAALCAQTKNRIYHVPFKKGWVKKSKTKIDKDVIDFSMFDERILDLVEKNKAFLTSTSTPQGSAV